MHTVVSITRRETLGAIPFSPSKRDSHWVGKGQPHKSNSQQSLSWVGTQKQSFNRTLTHTRVRHPRPTPEEETAFARTATSATCRAPVVNIPVSTQFFNSHAVQTEVLSSTSHALTWHTVDDSHVIIHFQTSSTCDAYVAHPN